jgi:hypothetical protein
VPSQKGILRSALSLDASCFSTFSSMESNVCILASLILKLQSCDSSSETALPIRCGFDHAPRCRHQAANLSCVYYLLGMQARAEVIGANLTATSNLPAEVRWDVLSSMSSMIWSKARIMRLGDVMTSDIRGDEDLLWLQVQSQAAGSLQALGAKVACTPNLRVLGVHMPQVRIPPPLPPTRRPLFLHSAAQLA